MTAKRVPYFQVCENTGWITPTMRGHKMACCDCGLVHNMGFRIVRIERLNGRKHGKLAVQIKASRNARATAGRRQGRKVKDSLRAIAKGAG